MAHPTDKSVGSRIRMARLLMGMSQQALGDILDVSFQQVQKYEKGSNRIAASKLLQIAVALHKPVGWFFADADTRGEDGATAIPPDLFSDFASLHIAVPLATELMKLKPVQRRCLLSLLESLNEAQAPAEAKEAA